jgi:hypothetical protein
MSRFHVGAVLDRVPAARYFEGVSHLELVLHGTPRAATAKKMRAGLPSGATLAVQLPGEIVRTPRGALRHETDAPVADLLAAVTALEPRFIVLVTGVELTPGPRDREALTTFVERLRQADAPPLVWQAGGPWESEQAVQFAQRLGVIPAIDPLQPVPFSGAIAYTRVRAIGVHARLGDGTLARIAEALIEIGAADTFVALEAGEGPKRARRLAQILAGESAGDGDGEDESAPSSDGEDDDE